MAMIYKIFLKTTTTKKQDKMLTFTLPIQVITTETSKY